MAYVVDAVRTPIGRAGGALRDVRPDVLAAHALRSLLDRAGVDPAAVDEVVFGCGAPVGEQAGDIGRAAALIAGLPARVPGGTVTRGDTSAQHALHLAATAVAAGVHDLVIAGGVASTSRVPVGAERRVDAVAAAPAAELAWRYTLVPPLAAAELAARRHGLSRVELDTWALESHRRAARAEDAGWFDGERDAVGRWADGWGPPLDTPVARDEAVRHGLALAALEALRPLAPPEGVLTEATWSPPGDGAGAVLIASERAVRRLGLRPRAKVVATASVGVDPARSITAAIPAARAALARAGLAAGDLAAAEVDEAFAPAALGACRALDLDPERVNVHGGALALGHPAGASGARLVATLLGVLDRLGGRFGLVAAGGGAGDGLATVLDREV